ncbi:MAG: DivIVA domain-containing protein [Ignavibacteriales bacterium]|nr:DivIVA domain-containing protein [Ignavibacteriales bacterium]
MKLTPYNIKNQEFSKSFRGFDVDEVKAFLDKLADEVERFQYDYEKLKGKVEEMNARIDGYIQIEKDLQRTLIYAQESSNKTVESTKMQTTLMIKEAEVKAAQILDNAQNKLNELNEVIIKLNEEKNLLIAKIKAIVQTQEKLLHENKKVIEVNLGNDKNNSEKKEIRTETIKLEPGKKQIVEDNNFIIVEDFPEDNL